MFDLNQYFEFIKIKVPAKEPIIRLLSDLITGHLQAFGYLYEEGKKPMERRIPGDISLDIVFNLLVKQRRYGDCFQNTE